MAAGGSSFALIFNLLLSLAFALALSANAQVPIPPKYDGFVYKPSSCLDRAWSGVIVEAFFDPLCPDSRDSWWPLKHALDFYGTNVTFIFHTFPLPYHTYAFIASRCLHIADGINPSYTYPLLEKFFRQQEEFSNAKTLNVSPSLITKKIIAFASEGLESSTRALFESGFTDKKTDTATRISFKYGCSRAVTGTPYFFVNGIPLISEETLDYEKWRKIIDPLLAGHIETVTRQRRLSSA